MGCADLQAQQTIYLSTDNPPMPAPVENAVCGLQVPGTKKPTKGTKFENLNSCPLNAYCNVWDQCGITQDFCTSSDSATGAPGSAAPGENGYISHCGTKITNNETVSAEFRKVGYFEIFNKDCEYLNMDISQFDISKYTHIHFAFAGISDDYNINVTGVQDQFDQFTKFTGVKKILSFGGWSFSISQNSFSIFRQGITEANQQFFAKNMAIFLTKYKLDGLNFDWEYSGAPDLSGIPAGSKSDGSNYLSFLQQVRSLLPAKSSLSIAVSASFWYLKGFPINAIADVVDYIIYMTYNLHRQWDYNHHWAVPDCSAIKIGCLRSHINLIETKLSLAIITKAGVPSDKIIVGVSSYGREFKMAEKEYTGPDCTFTEPKFNATPGKYTNTAGYISNAEIQNIINTTPSAKSIYNKSSYSNIFIYNSTQWVAYIDNNTKQSRTEYYRSLNIDGISDWTVDLQQYHGDNYSGNTPGNRIRTVYIPFSIWNKKSFSVKCIPLCTIILSPYPLGENTAVSFVSMVISVWTRSDSSTGTKTTILSLPSLAVSGIPYWPVVIDSSAISTEFFPLQSFMPPSRIIKLGGMKLYLLQFYLAAGHYFPLSQGPLIQSLSKPRRQVQYELVLISYLSPGPVVCQLKLVQLVVEQISVLYLADMTRRTPRVTVAYMVVVADAAFRDATNLVKNAPQINTMTVLVVVAITLALKKAIYPWIMTGPMVRVMVYGVRDLFGLSLLIP